MEVYGWIVLLRDKISQVALYHGWVKPDRDKFIEQAEGNLALSQHWIWLYVKKNLSLILKCSFPLEQNNSNIAMQMLSYWISLSHRKGNLSKYSHQHSFGIEDDSLWLQFFLSSVIVDDAHIGNVDSTYEAGSGCWGSWLSHVCNGALILPFAQSFFMLLMHSTSVLKTIPNAASPFWGVMD